jgi:hypothetical protein
MRRKSRHGGILPLIILTALLQAGCVTIGRVWLPPAFTPASRTITVYENHEIPEDCGISTGKYLCIDGYTFAHIFVEFEQHGPDEKPLDMGVVFAPDSHGRFGARRYFNFEHNFEGTATPQMITLSGEGCWHGSPHDRSSYVARLPVMGPYLQVFPFNHHTAPRKFSVVIYLTR